MRENGRALIVAIAVASTSLALAAPAAAKGTNPSHGNGTKGAKHGNGKGTKPARRNPAAGLFGVHPWEPPSQEEYQRMAAGGVSSIRLLISMEAVSPQPNVREWRLYDSIIGEAAKNGISVDPWLMFVPSWISPDRTSLPIWTPGQRSAWAGFVQAVAGRYGPGGTFWRQNPTIPAHPMVWWEIWNEPNINEFVGLNRTVRAGEFARLLRVTRSALNAANPANRIVLGGLYRRPKPGHGIKMTRFLTRLYKLRKGRQLFDAVGIHPYAAKPSQVLRLTRSVRRVMNKNGDPRKPIWITELGWTTGGAYWNQSLYRATVPQQATRVGRVTQLLIANRRRLALKRVDWFTWRDLDSSGSLFWAAYAGLFTADGHPKPAWSAFTQATGGFAGGPIRAVGHFGTIPPGPVVPPGGGGSTTPPPAQPQPPPPPHCVLIIFCS